MGMPVDMDAMYAGMDSSAPSTTVAGSDANTGGRREGAVLDEISGHVRTPTIAMRSAAAAAHFTEPP